MTDNAQILDLARRLALEILAADHAAVERNIRVAQIPCDRGPKAEKHATEHPGIEVKEI